MSKSFDQITTKAQELRQLMKEGNRLWREIVAAGGDPLTDARWSANADAECALREENGWTYAQTGIRNFMPRVA